MGNFYPQNNIKNDIGLRPVLLRLRRLAIVAGARLRRLRAGWQHNSPPHGGYAVAHTPARVAQIADRNRRYKRKRLAFARLAFSTALKTI